MKKNLLLAFIALSIVFIIAEAGLRIIGIKPGIIIKSRWFTEVDSLFTKQGFYADSNGIFKVSPSSRDSVLGRISRAYAANNIPDYNQNFEVPEVYSLAVEAVASKSENDSSTFNMYIKSLKALPVLTTTDSAITNYASLSPINEDGFRSIPFKNYNTTKKKVLLLGDSFTWGHSSNPKTNSFADLLLTKGYVVYNTGISGADPAQYLAIASQYIAALKPDYVIVNFFMGNDVLSQETETRRKYFERKVEPNIPIHYSTNAGNILSCPAGIYFNAPDEAYDFVVQQYRIPQNTLTNRILSSTAFGTIVWRALNRFHLISNKNTYDWYWKKAGALLTDKPTCNKEMAQIDSICKQHDSRFILVTINDIQNPAVSSTDKFPYLFENIKFYQSPVNADGYNTEDGHYNNEGHRIYAAFLDSLMGSTGANR